MDPIGVVVLHDDPAVARAVGETIDAAADLFVAGISASSRGAVLVAGGPSLAGLDDPNAPLVALADGDLIGAARAALALGARDLLQWPSEAHRLPDAVRAAARPQTPDAPAHLLTAVAGARGGLGVSTAVAVLAARTADAIALDLDPGAGQRAFAREEPSRTIADVAGLAPGAVEAALADHTGGARCLHAPPAAPPPDPAAARGLVRAARRLGPVVADCGRGMHAGQRAVLEVATTRVLICGDDVASVRGARVLLERLPGDWVLLVRRFRRLGVRARDIGAALGLPVAAVVRSDGVLARAADLGRLPRRRTRAMRALADTRLEHHDAHQ